MRTGSVDLYIVSMISRNIAANDDFMVTTIATLILFVMKAMRVLPEANADKS